MEISEPRLVRMRTREPLPRLNPKTHPDLFACEQESTCHGSIRRRSRFCSHANKKAPAKVPSEDASEFCSHANKRAPAEAPSEDAPGFVRMRTREPCQGSIRRRCPLLFACEQESPCRGSIRRRFRFVRMRTRGLLPRFDSQALPDFVRMRTSMPLPRFNPKSLQVLFACEQRRNKTRPTGLKIRPIFVRMRTRLRQIRYDLC